jgi:hypothetical protein
MVREGDVGGGVAAVLFWLRGRRAAFSCWCSLMVGSSRATDRMRLDSDRAGCRTTDLGVRFQIDPISSGRDPALLMFQETKSNQRGTTVAAIKSRRAGDSSEMEVRNEATARFASLFALR